MTKWTIQILKYVSLFFVLVVIIGSIYEIIAQKYAPVTFPPSGKMVQLQDGREIQLNCHGNGTPTVVFEAGGDSLGSLSWSTVHDSIAGFTRACSYSRSGIMWSSGREGEASGKAIAADLHNTLRIAGEKPPYVLVGQSLGGPLITVYNSLYSNEVAGFVFVDATHPDTMKRFKNAVPSFVEPHTSWLNTAFLIIARTGILRVLAILSGGIPYQPENTIKPWAAFSSSSYSELFNEFDHIDEYFAIVRNNHNFGKKPLFVLTSMASLTEGELSMFRVSFDEGKQLKQVWKALHDDEATWSSNSQHLNVPDSGHYIQFERPDLVIAATKWVVNEVRSGPK